MGRGGVYADDSETGSSRDSILDGAECVHVTDNREDEAVKKR